MPRANPRRLRPGDCRRGQSFVVCRWMGSGLAMIHKFSWRLGSDFYLRTAWTHPAAASFSLDSFVNKQLTPEY
jgi:hypothetical protein